MKNTKTWMPLGACACVLIAMVGLAGCPRDIADLQGLAFAGIRITGMPYERREAGPPPVATDESIGFVMGSLATGSGGVGMLAIIYASYEFGDELGIPEIRPEADGKTSAAESPLFMNVMWFSMALQNWRNNPNENPLPTEIPATTQMDIVGTRDISLAFAVVGDQDTAMDPNALIWKRWTVQFPDDLDDDGILTLRWADGI